MKLFSATAIAAVVMLSTPVMSQSVTVSGTADVATYSNTRVSGDQVGSARSLGGSIGGAGALAGSQASIARPGGAVGGSTGAISASGNASGVIGQGSAWNSTSQEAGGRFRATSRIRR